MKQQRKCLLVYYTGTFNTRFLSQRIQKQMEEAGFSVTLYEIDPLNHEQLDYASYDLVGFGYPIYGFAAPYPFLKFIRSQHFPKGMHYFIYKNSGETFHDNDASSKYVIRALRRRGAVIDSEYHYPMPYNIHFRYEDKLVREILHMDDKLIRIMIHELQNGIHNWKGYGWFAWFATTLVARWQYIGGDINSWLYKVDKNKCIDCDLCIKSCPTKNIYRNEKNDICFHHNCLMCMRCSIRCPKDAIWIGFLDSWRWKVNGAYNFKRIEQQNYEPVISSETTGFFECYIEKFNKINQRYYELFGGDEPVMMQEPKKEKSMLFRLFRLAFTGVDVQEP